jgi:hypothetical protein
MWESFDISQPNGPPWPVTGIALAFLHLLRLFCLSCLLLWCSSWMQHTCLLGLTEASHTGWTTFFTACAVDHLDTNLYCSCKVTSFCLKIVFWNVMSCCPVDHFWHFWGMCGHHLQGRRVSWAWKKAVLIMDGWEQYRTIICSYCYENLNPFSLLTIVMYYFCKNIGVLHCNVMPLDEIGESMLHLLLHSTLSTADSKIDGIVHTFRYLLYVYHCPCFYHTRENVLGGHLLRHLVLLLSGIFIFALHARCLQLWQAGTD